MTESFPKLVNPKTQVTGRTTCRSYRNYVTKRVRKAHHDYVNDVIGKNISENPKSFWSYIKLTKTENLGVPTLKTSQKMCSTDYDKAEALNAQFQSVFNPKLSHPG